MAIDDLGATIAEVVGRKLTGVAGLPERVIVRNAELMLGDNEPPCLLVSWIPGESGSATFNGGITRIYTVVVAAIYSINGRVSSTADEADKAIKIVRDSLQPDFDEGTILPEVPTIWDVNMSDPESDKELQKTTNLQVSRIVVSYSNSESVKGVSV